MAASNASRALRQEYTKLRDITRKRVTRLKDANLLDQSSLKRYEKEIPRARDLTDKEIRRELGIMRRNLYSKPSGSLKGVQEIQRRHEEAVADEKERLKAKLQNQKDKLKEQQEAASPAGRPGSSSPAPEPDDDDEGEDYEITYDSDVIEYADRVFNLTNNIMALLRAFHLDEAYYRLTGSSGAKDENQASYDKLSDQVRTWLDESPGNRDEYKFKAFRDIIGPELAKYDEGVEIVERTKTSSRRRSTGKIRALGDALTETITGEIRTERNQKAAARKADRKARKG